MTCIVGVIDLVKQTVIIGGDSSSSNDENIFIRKDSKVFTNGPFVIGCAGSFRMIQLLKYSFVPPEIGEKDIFEYMCTDFINNVRQCFREGGYIQRFQDGDEKGGIFLVGYKNRLFLIDIDFQVAEHIDNYSSIGCGSNFALGSLHTSNNEMYSPKERVLLALEAATYLSPFVIAPFTLIETLNQQNE
jgi:ATP-dependent protease HslVU (ClpYQ) peptidase subunit